MSGVARRIHDNRFRAGLRARRAVHQFTRFGCLVVEPAQRGARRDVGNDGVRVGAAGGVRTGRSRHVQRGHCLRDGADDPGGRWRCLGHGRC